MIEIPGMFGKLRCVSIYVCSLTPPFWVNDIQIYTRFLLNLPSNKQNEHVESKGENPIFLGVTSPMKSKTMLSVYIRPLYNHTITRILRIG